MEDIKRKPDVETESLRVWKAQKDSFTKEDEEDSFEIELNEGMKIKCLGFTRILDKNDKSLIFAYKFKEHNKTILYHTIKETEESKKVLQILKEFSKGTIYQLQDLSDSLTAIESNKHIFEKIKK
jgi:hypothetical protein